MRLKGKSMRGRRRDGKIWKDMKHFVFPKDNMMRHHKTLGNWIITLVTFMFNTISKNAIRSRAWWEFGVFIGL